MSEQKKEIKVNLDPVLYGLSNVNINFNEEVFDFLLISGNQGRQFRATPKHAKRIKIILERSINEYEKRYGEIKVELPQKRESAPEERIGFNR